MRFDAGRYPPPLDRPRLLRARLQRRVELALSLVTASCPRWGCALDNWGRSRDGDPLSGLTVGGQKSPEPRMKSAWASGETGRARMRPDAEASLPASVSARTGLVSAATRIAPGGRPLNENRRRIGSTDPVPFRVETAETVAAWTVLSPPLGGTETNNVVSEISGTLTAQAATQRRFNARNGVA
jgi:hypothetical protein